ncbi:uncharacterized protein F4822DRAFT_442216 [Hypoxylon trugodes]|uniref:uncharacterized protein n=1 Tax=Hypoxylon trugodes TaxID=326681 RepID=UPI002195E99D|nr:uncharacterized protein F4822DRAFT_442216 [Hypoxylon trugodes]KAI1391080.1 hypothetical protein F4822DRAFT_442216 [Hypoxylon trugodes]
MAGSSTTVRLDACVQSHNRNSIATPTPTTTTTQQPTYSKMLDKVEEARRKVGAKTDEFFTDEDVRNNSPRGWPSIAATQMYLPDFNCHRGFTSLIHRTLTFYELRIHCIEDKLDELDFEDDEANGNQLRSLPFDKDQFIARCLQGAGHLPTKLSPDQTNREAERENLIISSGNLQREYFQLLHMQYENKKFAKVSRRVQEAHFNDAQIFEHLDNKARAFMRYIDDFLNFEPDYVFQRFETLFYTNSRWVQNILRHICCIGRNKSSPTSSADGVRPTYSLRPVKLFVKTFLVLGNLALLIIPVSVLYLRIDLSRGQKLAITAASSVCFSIVMATFENRTAHLLVGITAFFAVLVTFLSNLPDSDSGM